MNYQDVLAELGAGVAHPGGAQSSNLWMSAISWNTDMRVLDVGCGTGSSLIRLQQSHGCHVTGVDIRQKMIEKARMRAKEHQVGGEWMVASAEKLPFPDETFDVVITESVNVFVDASKSVRECFRVLKPGGVYVDVEMLVLGPVKSEWKKSVQEVYGARWVPDQKGWKQLYQGAGFLSVRALSTHAVGPEQAIHHPGDQIYEDIITPGAYQNPDVVRVLQQNGHWMETNHRHLGYSVFLCMKSGGA